MNLNTSALLATASLFCLISQVGAQEPQVATDPAVKSACRQQPGFIGGPFVPTA